MCCWCLKTENRGWLYYYRLVKFAGSEALHVGAFNVNQVLEMIRRVLTEKCNTWNETVMCIGWVLSNLVESRNLATQLGVTSLQLLATVLETCIVLLSAFVKTHKSRDQEVLGTKNEAVLLMSCITLSATR
jgi:hypothetical protein